MKILVCAVFLAITIGGVATNVGAAEFFVLPNTNTLLMMGETKPSDVEHIQKYIIQDEVDSFVLKGPGGDLEAGYAIAKLMLDNNFTVILPKNTECASACSLIFSAGKTRLMESGSRLGIHLPFLKLDKDNIDDYCDELKYTPKEGDENLSFQERRIQHLIELQSLSRSLGGRDVECITLTFQFGLRSIRKLRKIFARDGISDEVIDIMISTNPNDMVWIDVDRARQLGLENSQQD